jgi:predicted enzyme related to lactoylglutathione lyase
MSEESTSAPIPGRVVWHDLMSKDPAKAQAFYEALFGWNVSVVPMEGFGDYHMIHVGETGIGGIVPLDAAVPAPSHWMGYVQVDDVDAASATAAASGGQSCVPPTDIPGVGRFSVITDPTGGAISPFKSASGPIPDAEPPVGAFCWDELLTRDPAACASFYTEVFPWRREATAMPEGEYHLFKRANDEDGAGMMQMPPEAEAPSHWLAYVLVEDVDASAAKAKELGATIYVEPRDIPGIGRFSVLADPAGAAFAVYKPAAQGA